MESWREVWRAVGWRLSSKALTNLAKAIQEDDKRLIQGSTTAPPPLQYMHERDAEGACLLGYAGMAEGLQKVGEIENYFASICYDIGQYLKEPTACRWLLNWYDDTPREEMRRQLLPEVLRIVQIREALLEAPQWLKDERFVKAAEEEASCCVSAGAEGISPQQKGLNNETTRMVYRRKQMEPRSVCQGLRRHPRRFL